MCYWTSSNAQDRPCNERKLSILVPRVLRLKHPVVALCSSPLECVSPSVTAHSWVLLWCLSQLGCELHESRSCDGACSYRVLQAWHFPAFIHGLDPRLLAVSIPLLFFCKSILIFLWATNSSAFHLFLVGPSIAVPHLYPNPHEVGR